MGLNNLPNNLPKVRNKNLKQLSIVSDFGCYMPTTKTLQIFLIQQNPLTLVFAFQHLIFYIVF